MRADASVTAARRLIDAVMVVSRLGLQLPQSIALRLIGRNVPAYRSSMSEDIIVEHEFERDVFTLSARHPLEAEIWRILGDENIKLNSDAAEVSCRAPRLVPELVRSNPIEPGYVPRIPSSRPRAGFQR